MRKRRIEMKPLSDISVIDFTHTIAGPYCTQLLSGMGAQVIKVEPPGGEYGREFLDGNVFASYNFGKKSVSIDLKSERGQEVAEKLIENSDVLVENFRPGVMENFGLDWERLSQCHDSLVYCSITGFGQEGPYKDHPAYDPVIQAISGIMSITGHEDRPPVRSGISAIDAGTGTMAAFLISSAIAGNRANESVRRLEVSLFDIAVSWMSHWIAYTSTKGEVPKRAGGGIHGSAPNDLFKVGDGELLLISAPNDDLFGRLCDAINREDLCADERFNDNADRWENRQELQMELEEAFKSWESEELKDRILAYNVPTSRVQDVADLINDPHVEARGMLRETRNMIADTDTLTSVLPFRLDNQHVNQETMPPELGTDNELILSSLGYGGKEIESIVDDNVIR